VPSPIILGHVSYIKNKKEDGKKEQRSEKARSATFQSLSVYFCATRKEAKVVTRTNMDPHP
jgi:hypothetical protein